MERPSKRSRPSRTRLLAVMPDNIRDPAIPQLQNPPDCPIFRPSQGHGMLLIITLAANIHSHLLITRDAGWPGYMVCRHPCRVACSLARPVIISAAPQDATDAVVLPPSTSDIMADEARVSSWEGRPQPALTWVGCSDTLVNIGLEQQYPLHPVTGLGTASMGPT
jgi:hypothetical protein